MIETTQTLFGTHTQEIIEGDCLSVMKTYPDNHFNVIICDPPYMLNFMNKKFDKFKDNPAANPEYWKEALRISKPGTMLAAFGGDRTHHHLMIALEQAGWEIRTCLYWLFASGFPKSNNFGRKLSEEWHGYGTALKPSTEIIVLAMKPVEKTFAFNAEKWGVAGLNIDICRIATNDKWKQKCQDIRNGGLLDKKGRLERISQSNDLGRWPASCIFSESMSKILDDQSGVSKSQIGLSSKKNKTDLCYGKFKENSPYLHNDSGGASRFFKVIEDEPPFFYCPKVSPSERNKGLEGMPLIDVHRYGPGVGEGHDPKGPSKDRNFHPTVKPLKLIKYLIQLLAPPKDALLLDPYAGSGTTILGAKQLEINAVGIEKEPEYCRIAERRIRNES